MEFPMKLLCANDTGAYYGKKNRRNKKKNFPTEEKSCLTPMATMNFLFGYSRMSLDEQSRRGLRLLPADTINRERLALTSDVMGSDNSSGELHYRSIIHATSGAGGLVRNRFL